LRHLTPRPPLRVTTAVTLITCAAAVAGCGSSSNGRKTAGRPDFIAYSQCMRSHGVPNFPDPGSGGGIQLNSSSGINPASPSFKAAQIQCQKLLPGGGPGNQHPTEADKQAMLKISECMRAHGITGFPDPTTSNPINLNPNNYGLVMDRGGVTLAVPKTIDIQSPAYQHASSQCGFGPPPGAKGLKTKSLS
jgi:hypothetical protein